VKIKLKFTVMAIVEKVGKLLFVATYQADTGNSNNYSK
jgi:hypothetical protein